MATAAELLGRLHRPLGCANRPISLGRVLTRETLMNTHHPPGSGSLLPASPRGRHQARQVGIWHARRPSPPHRPTTAGNARDVAPGAAQGRGGGASGGRPPRARGGAGRGGGQRPFPGRRQGLPHGAFAGRIGPGNGRFPGPGEVDGRQRSPRWSANAPPVRRHRSPHKTWPPVGIPAVYAPSWPTVEERIISPLGRAGAWLSPAPRRPSVPQPRKRALRPGGVHFPRLRAPFLA